jgi:tetratricopeptide (TPR) repeat protein
MTTFTLELLLAHAEAFRKAVSAHYPVPRRLIQAFPDELDFELLSGNQTLAWDEELIAAHPLRWAWRELASNPALPWSVSLIKKYVPKRWAWDDLMSQPRVFADPDLFALCLPHWGRAARRGQGERDDLGAGGYQLEPFAPDAASWALGVIEAARGVEWDLLSAVPEIPWTADVIDRNAARLDWRRLSWNRGLPWGVELLRRFEARWDWSSLSPGLPWSEELIAAFADRWSWRLLALWVPWTEALLDRFAERIWWASPSYDHGVFQGIGGLLNHEGFRWTPALYRRHGAHVARHIDRLREGLAAEGEELPDERETHWTYYCDTGNWTAEMLSLAAAHEANSGAEAVNWDNVCSHARHLWGDELIAAHRHLLSARVGALVSNRHFPWHRHLADFADATPDGYLWSGLSGNPGLRLDAEMLERYQARWRWEALSSNPNLTDELIARYADRWDWRALSRNPALSPAAARAFAARLHGPSLSALPWASPRAADPELPWDFRALFDREPAALRELLSEPLLEAFLAERSRRRGPRASKKPPRPPKAPGPRPHPSTPEEMAELCDALWTRHASRELAAYGQAVLAYFEARGDVPARIVDEVLVKTGIGYSDLGLREGIPLLLCYIRRAGEPFQYANIARIHLALGELELAAAALDRAPRTFYTLRIRGKVLEAAGRLDEAEAAYRASVAEQAQNNEAGGDLAALLRRKRR